MYDPSSLTYYDRVASIRSFNADTDIDYSYKIEADFSTQACEQGQHYKRLCAVHSQIPPSFFSKICTLWPLEVINYKNGNLSDEHLKEIAQCKFLEELNISTEGKSSITDGGVNLIKQKCIKLTAIDLTGHSQLSKDTLAFREGVIVFPRESSPVIQEIQPSPLALSPSSPPESPSTQSNGPTACSTFLAKYRNLLITVTIVFLAVLIYLYRPLSKLRVRRFSGLFWPLFD